VAAENAAISEGLLSVSALKMLMAYRNGVLLAREADGVGDCEQLPVVTAEENTTELTRKRTYRRLVALEEKRLELLGILFQKCEDLTLQEFIVEQFCETVSQLENRTKTLSLGVESDPERIREYQEMDDRWSKLAKRRRILEARREMIRSQLREMEVLYDRRLKMSPPRVRAMRMGGSSSEDISDSMRVRFDTLVGSLGSVTLSQTELDDLELSNTLQRRRMEKEWGEKIARVETLRVEADERDILIAKIAREADGIAHAKENSEVLTTTREVIERHIEAVDAERAEMIAKDPEFVFRREKITERQAVADERASRIADRQEKANNLGKEVDTGVEDTNDLLKRILELEAELARLGVKMAEASEVVKAEDAVLDALLAPLPQDEKIRIMSLV
jgi:hypothetical protein